LDFPKKEYSYPEALDCELPGFRIGGKRTSIEGWAKTRIIGEGGSALTYFQVFLFGWEN